MSSNKFESKGDNSKSLNLFSDKCSCNCHHDQVNRHLVGKVQDEPIRGNPLKTSKSPTNVTVIDLIESDDSEETNSSSSPIKSRKLGHSKNDLNRVSSYNSNIFAKLVEDNFLTISFHDEVLALGIEMRQFEQQKFEELNQFVDQFNERKTVEIIHFKEYKSIIDHLHNEERNWILSLKKVSSFRNICIDDQMSCLKINYVDLYIIRSLLSLHLKVIQANQVNHFN